MISPVFKVIPEIDGELVTEQEIEYSYCLHCKEFYDHNLPSMSARLTPHIIWWHFPHCPHEYDEPEVPEFPPCPLELCDGSGVWKSLYPGEPFTCFCKRP